jgi:hypothetical protein
MGIVLTAWVAPDDGLLARQTAEGLDIVFTDDGAGADTDLEGLRIAFDSDGDGKLTAGDDFWAQFGVWQDADSDGETDGGEFRSLDEAGIASIDLISDHDSYEAADGDVTVHGEAEVAFTDGSTGIAADASFTTGAMEALLAMADGATSGGDQSTDEEGDLSAVGDALAEAQAEGYVDYLIDQLGTGDVQTAANDTDGDLAGLLSSDVGTFDLTGLSAHDFNQIMEDVSALAAAQA